ncbi:HAMP domain-containing histidine kinase [Streptomyces filamentosus]|uniref:histidine kinase n=2 Tax=Streptomyces filamentosus TaxID=67294 RepID=A0ABY4UW58_STRFL|nr:MULTISPECIES: HAMP domain-containing sensor histidine kinase [Streptomyces]MYR80125.1 HAMP domain-containing protein [Streptomyces sp. SID5466]EFE76106.1 two-component system sensor kinase [Streptomyces filamentosus NRRL 15998]ESU49909.1 putative two-component system sensor kinase [Streptomyces sp. HCCB10043]EWS93103.1 phosphate regulon sensor kinase PhoR [Streptomyces filamentosus NRRL 11379]USC48339.1 HAMP domain-containing histidine kinase [Streptomyces filamentosus]
MLRRPWTLRTRLVVSAVSLIAVVAAVIGSVTAIAFHSYMYGKLDDQLHSVVERAQRPPGPLPLPETLREAGPLGFVGGGGQPLGTFGALVDGDGDITASKVVEDSGLRAQESAKPLTAEQRSALEAAVPETGEGARSVDLPGLGGYRVEATTTAEGYTVLVGIPSAEVSGALTTLIVVEICVTAAGLIAASIAGTVLVGVALRPLRRVAATATRVSELPLHRGEVALLERVPDAEADPRTEVGQVGAALNRMLGHVGSALAARQESETRVRQFVADASHELRTPLASIRGYAELTRRAGGGGAGQEPDPVTRHALGRIESEADRMTGLVEDLLLLARLDAGRPLSYGSIDLLPLVVDAVSDARAADQRGTDAGGRHHWRLELPDTAEPVTVRADPERLQQVLVNLLANARTHTPPGTTVTVSVQPPVRGGGPVTLEVRDDGPGVPVELLPHVFERFARGDASRARGADSGGATGSTGLGLAIVQAVVSAHGGRVAVESGPGRTVFAVELPTDAVPADGAPGIDSQAGDRLTTPV